MKDLKAPPNYLTKGFIHTLLEEGKTTLLYSKTSKCGYQCYEVFEKRERVNRMIFDSFVKETLRMPSGEDFGRWAWSEYCLEKAKNRFIHLENCTKT